MSMEGRYIARRAAELGVSVASLIFEHADNPQFAPKTYVEPWDSADSEPMMHQIGRRATVIDIALGMEI